MIPCTGCRGSYAAKVFFGENGYGIYKKILINIWELKRNDQKIWKNNCNGSYLCTDA